MPSEVTAGESALGRLYRVTYDRLCGRHPRVRPWHFQWLDTRPLYRDLRRVLGGLSGRVLDVGCGAKPYRDWFGPVTAYVGLDVVDGPEVDVVVDPHEPWPLADATFDVLLASQVLEHVADLPLTLGEMTRVVRPGGTMVVSFPFLYNEHGAPFDFQRFTAHRAARLFPQWDVVQLERQGGVGSTLTILLLNWIEESMNARFATRLLKAPLLPLWLVGCLALNCGGLVLDQLDRTAGYYSNLMLVLRKAPADRPTPARGGDA